MLCGGGAPFAELVPEAFDFFEGLAFGFWEPAFDAEEAQDADAGVEPERAGGA